MLPGIVPIVAALTLAVCATGAAGAVSPEAFGRTRVSDIVGWIDQNWAWIVCALSVVSVIILIRFRALRPGGLNAGGSGSGGRDVKPIPAIMWLFASMATFFMLVLGGTAASTIPMLEDAPIRGQALQLTVSFGIAAVFGIGMLWFVARQAGDAAVKPGWADPGLGVCIFLLIYPLVALSALIALWIARGVGAAGQDRLAHETLQMIGQHKDDPWVWLLIGVLVLIVPLVEELIYRVFLQSALLRAVRSRWLAVVLTSVLFVAAHWTVLPEGGKYAAAPLFVLSVSMGAAYERTGRLGVPIMMHGLFNALNLALAFMIDPMV